MAKLLRPETETSKTSGDVTMVVERTDSNIIDAAARGAAQGVQLAINVAAMLVAFIALIALLNGIIGGICSLFTDQKITLELVMGYCFSPLAFIMGVPWHEAVTVGSLLGKKIILNEFVAYADLAPMIKAHALSSKAQMIATYALCGFANFSSIGIQLGGIGPLAPNKKHDLARLGLRALLGGALATCLTATIAGIIGA
jgi:CNT family concentrative nucleoside transporter